MYMGGDINLSFGKKIRGIHTSLSPTERKITVIVGLIKGFSIKI